MKDATGELSMTAVAVVKNRRNRRFIRNFRMASNQSQHYKKYLLFTIKL